ncbi:hypothetical protein DL93DRAFT_1333871 [Clavulina sp. PMI_390]|nr:hypothetical protein DL93DRAFT_1333871 [Clavulina sp. PMI_390]
MKPGIRWAWPIWGGICMILGIFPLLFIVVLVLGPFDARHRRRAEERRRRKEELLDSNRAMARLPAAIDALPAVPAPAVTYGPTQGDLEAQNWATNTIAALQPQAGPTPASGQCEPDEKAPVVEHDPATAVVSAEPETAVEKV